MKSRNIKPVYLYLLGGACFILSRIFEENGIAVLNYLFAVLGFVLFFAAVRKYFKKG